MSPLIWSLEWRRALAQRRRRALWVLGSLGVLFVIATGAVPPLAAARMYTALFALLCGLTSAMELHREGRRGMVRRIVRGGVGAASYFLQRAAVETTLAVVQALPSLVLFAAIMGAPPGGVLSALGALTLTAWVSVLLGMAVGAVSDSFLEAATVVGVGLSVLFHASGVFRPVPPGGAWSVLASFAPFRALNEALGALVVGGGAAGGPTLVAWAVVVPAAMALGSAWLVRPFVTPALGRTGPRVV